MDRKLVKRRDEYRWLIERTGRMQVDGLIYASEQLIAEMDDMVARQVSNVASLPGIAGYSYAMPDAHWGYGFCIGGVAAFDPERGIISAGFDMPRRTMHTDEIKFWADEGAGCRCPVSSYSVEQVILLGA